MKVYVTNIEKCSLTIPEMEKKLNLNFLKTIKREKSQLDYKRSLIAYTLLNIACKSKLQLFRNLSIKKNIYGKPYFTQLTDCFFNISHSGKWVVLAISSSEMGIDVEENIEFDYTEIVNTVLTKEEKQFFECIVDEHKKEIFYRFWTLKESYIKALGKGMSKKLNSFTIELWNNSIMVTNDNEMIFLEIPFYKGYTLSICCRKQESLKCLKVLKL